MSKISNVRIEVLMRMEKLKSVMKLISVRPLRRNFHDP